MDIQNTPARFIRAIRQIMLEKDCTQVVFEPNAYPVNNDIPRMLHYDGAFAPIETVTLPESVPEDQREANWSPADISRGIILCCSDNGAIHTELVTGVGTSAGVQWDYLLCCLYDELLDPKEDPDWDEWLEAFEKALADGVPAEARALRARLLRQGYSEDNPCDTGASHLIPCTLFTPQYQSLTTYEFRSVWPKDDTLVIVDGSDSHEVELRNTFDKKSLSGETFDCRPLLDIHTDNDDLVRERLRRRLSALLSRSDESDPVAAYPLRGEDLPAELLAEHPNLKGSFITGAFQVPGDGTIWLTFYCDAEPLDFDEVPTALLEALADELSNRLDWVAEVRNLLRNNRDIPTDALIHERPVEEGTTIGEDEACGLSSLEMPKAQAAWLDGDGRITVRTRGAKDPLRENALSIGDLRSLQTGILMHDRRQRAVDGIKDLVTKAGGTLSCHFAVPDYIISLAQTGVAHITDISLDEQGEPVLRCEGYDSEGFYHTDHFGIEMLENLRSHLHSRTTDTHNS